VVPRPVRVWRPGCAVAGDHLGRVASPSPVTAAHCEVVQPPHGRSCPLRCGGKEVQGPEGDRDLGLPRVHGDGTARAGRGGPPL